jgi:hypothetical protein
LPQTTEEASTIFPLIETRAAPGIAMKYNHTTPFFTPQLHFVFVTTRLGASI